MTVMIRFLLNNDIGDCGACTVVLVSPSDTPSGLPLQYAGANSCILLVGALHGKQLITVEHLGTPTRLHPVQQALVEHHASQCGFCTPGFVMSLFTLFHQEFAAQETYSQPDLRHALIEQYLGGNLCRCTGYRPIIAAAEMLLDIRLNQEVQDVFDERAAATARTLLNCQQKQNAEVTTSVHVPTSIVEALSLWKLNPTAQIIAGGTDLGLAVTQQLQTWPAIIHISNVRELKTVQHEPDRLVVGAGVTITELLDIMTLDFPDAAPMLLRFGSEQVRSQATVGGNLGTASPIGDLPPLLLALNASIELIALPEGSSAPQTRIVALADYFTGYRETQRDSDEWIYAVHIPVLAPADTLRVYKISKRMDDDISSVCAAIWAQTIEKGGIRYIQNIRLAFGGMAALPMRANHTETVLQGSELTTTVIAKAAQALHQDFQPIDDARATASYRLQVAGNLLHRFQIELTEPDVLTDITVVDSCMESTL